MSLQSNLSLRMSRLIKVDRNGNSIPDCHTMARVLLSTMTLVSLGFSNTIVITPPMNHNQNSIDGGSQSRSLGWLTNNIKFIRVIRIGQQSILRNKQNEEYSNDDSDCTLEMTGIHSLGAPSATTIRQKLATDGEHTCKCRPCD